jgi:hypothetical protein
VLTRQRLPENEEPQHSREHEVRTRVDDTDANCATRQRKSAREKSPHDGIEEQIHPEEELPMDVVSLGKDSRQSRSRDSLSTTKYTYTSNDDFNDHALFFHAEEMRESGCPGCCEVSCG